MYFDDKNSFARHSEPISLEVNLAIDSMQSHNFISVENVRPRRRHIILYLWSAPAMLMESKNDSLWWLNSISFVWEELKFSNRFLPQLTTNFNSFIHRLLRTFESKSKRLQIIHFTFYRLDKRTRPPILMFFYATIDHRYLLKHNQSESLILYLLYLFKYTK